MKTEEIKKQINIEMHLITIELEKLKNNISLLHEDTLNLKSELKKINDGK